MKKLAPREITAFRAQIWAFYRHSGRKLPWRKVRDPYKILVSEVMLQQTQVSRVLEKYPEFLKKFPAIEALAKASLGDVLRVWQGMGYNRRAKYLHDAAHMVVENFKGRIPRSDARLQTLPGIGPYTARAILTFAFNEPHVFIETNIRRVYIHHFFQKKKNVHDKDLLPLIAQTLDVKNPREWYWALMDYGSHLPKVIKNPNRKSKHYSKQSTFKGSLREIRGKIVRTLAERSLSLAQIKKVCADDDRTKRALESLLSDKLIVHAKRTYRLA